MELEVGDIIKLRNRIDEDVKVKTGDRVLFLGRAGISNNHKAVKVTEKIFEKKSK